MMATQTGLLPLLLTSHYRRWRVFGPARCLFVIHNMGYHGNFPNPLMYNYNLPDPRDTPKWCVCLCVCVCVCVCVCACVLYSNV